MRNIGDIRDDFVRAIGLQYGLESGVRRLRPDVNECDEGLSWLAQNRKNTMISNIDQMGAIAKRAGEIVVAGANISSAADTRLKVGARTVHASFTEAFEGTNDREHSMAVLDTTAAQTSLVEDIERYGRNIVMAVDGTHDEDSSAGLVRAREHTRDAGIAISQVGAATMIIVQNVNEYLARNNMDPLPPAPSEGQ